MSKRMHRLGDLCRLERGTYPTLKTLSGPYPLVVTAEFRRSADSWQMEGPAVCVPLISSTGHGNAALHRVHYQEGKFALANLLVALLPKNPEHLSAKYLYHLLMARKEELLVPLMLGTANVSLKEQDIAGVEIPLPPLSEQRRIVAKIDALAAKIEEARSLRQQATEEAELLLDSARKTVFEPDNGRGNVTRLAECDLFLNRESRNPSRSNPNDSFKYVDISSVHRGPYTVRTGTVVRNQDAPSRARRLIRAGDLIVSTVRPNLRAFAKVGEELDNQICSTGFAVVTCGPTLDPDFLLHQFCSPGFIKQCMTLATGGHYPAINDTNLRDILIVTPPIPEQRRIVAYLDALQAEVDALKHLQAKTAAELDALLPSILDKAFKGELVGQDPNDAPASILPEKVKSARKKSEIKSQTC